MCTVKAVYMTTSKTKVVLIIIMEVASLRRSKSMYKYNQVIVIERTVSGYRWHCNPQYLQDMDPNKQLHVQVLIIRLWQMIITVVHVHVVHCICVCALSNTKLALDNPLQVMYMEYMYYVGIVQR